MTPRATQKLVSVQQPCMCGGPPRRTNGAAALVPLLEHLQQCMQQVHWEQLPWVEAALSPLESDSQQELGVSQQELGFPGSAPAPTRMNRMPASHAWIHA